MVKTKVTAEQVAAAQAEAAQLRESLHEIEEKCRGLAARADASTAAGTAAVERWHAAAAEVSQLRERVKTQVPSNGSSSTSREDLERALVKANERSEQLVDGSRKMQQELDAMRDRVGSLERLAKESSSASAKARIAEERASKLQRNFEKIGEQLKDEHALRQNETRRCIDLETRVVALEEALDRAKNQTVRTTRELERCSSQDKARHAALDRAILVASRLSSDLEARSSRIHDSGADLADRVERIGAVLAKAGELRDAERVHENTATLRSCSSGALHAEQANGLRQLAAHCQGDLHAALSYLERSCSKYTSSLQAGEASARQVRS